VAIQPQPQITQQEQTFQPVYDKGRTKALIDVYKTNPALYQDKLETIRAHANYHNMPFYEGDFSILEAVKQAAGGFFEGFTTLRIADPPDNEYEAVARNIGHLAGFVPGLLSGPLKALGLTSMARAAGGLKSIPMLGADLVTKQAKKIIKPVLKASRGSRFDAVDTASKFMLADKAKHMAEGAFHLGVASSISSVWDGVDQMMHSFAGGAMAGGVFRGIGNIIPGTTTGDKVIRGLAGSMFMGLPTTMRGATTPEQIYEYLAGAYFGSNEMPFYRARAMKYMQKGDKLAETDVKFELERNPERIEGFDKEPEIVQKETKQIMEKNFGNPLKNRGIQFGLMEELGILKEIPAEKADTDGYKVLSTIKKGIVSATKKKAHDQIHIATSGGARGAQSAWGKEMGKYKVPVVHYLTKGADKAYKSRRVKGAGDIRRDISDKELYSLGHIVDKANQTLQRNLKGDNYKYFLSNAHQVKNANSIVAIGEIESGKSGKLAHLNGTTVKGSAGWAVQMGLDKGLQKIYVFDQRQQSWFKWNFDAGSFVPQKYAPKLTRNPALVGTRKLTVEGKQAIKDVAQTTFGDKPLVKSKVKSAIPEEKLAEYHPKTAKNLEIINQDIKNYKKEVKLIQKSIKQKPDAKRLQTLKEDLKDAKQYLRDLEFEKREHTRLATTQWKDTDTGRTMNDTDTGMTAAEYPLMKKGEYFATNYLRDLWKDSEYKRDDILNYGMTVEKAVRNNFEKGNKNVKVAEAINEIEDALNVKFKEMENGEDATRQVKRWMTELNLGEQVTYIQTVDGKNVRFTKSSRPVSLSGKSLSQLEPKKLVQEVYEIEGGKLNKGEESSLVIFDAVTKRNQRGMRNDIPLDKLEDFYKYQMRSKNPVKDANEIKSKVISQMAKRDMYPLGGQGDKGRIVFVKLHPTTQKVSKSKIKTDLVKIRKSLRKVDKKATTLLTKDRKNAEKEFGITPEQFDKMLHSNIMYDLSLNGFKNTPANIDKIMGPGFIPSAIAYNKRAQIWMTNGYGGNKDFIGKYKGEDGKTLELSKDGNYNYILVKDPEKIGKSSLKALSTELPEHVDGAIIVRDDVINAINKDAGHPESGQNKSFIIDPSSEHGALLGKYMMHAAGKTATAEMQKKGLHMMVMTSAAKQTGTRVIGDYGVKNGKLDIGKTPMYELDPGSVKYNSSVINDHHMVQKQIWVKQLFTNLHQFGHKAISKEVIDDIHNEVIQKKFDGVTEINDALDSYTKTFDHRKIDYLLDNLESIGTSKLTDALKTPGAELFAERALQRMLRVVEKDVEADYRAGNITAEARHQSLRDMQSSIGPIDKLLRNVAIVGEEMAAEGKTGYSGYMHKFIAPYKAAVLHNYFVKSVTRPEMDNSAVARIRPYDKFMQEKFPELNKDDSIFYLDAAYKNTKIKMPNGKDTTLGKLWEAYNDKKIKLSPADKKFTESVFEAVVLRVPMDSMSGAHRLNFKGFTGREGHGILMHSRTMRAIGGADLDGDEAFVYFGGKKENGEGFGMKKSWKDAIHDQKFEFIDPKTKDYKDNKKDFREELTEGADPNNPLKKSKGLYFSPYSRLKASEGAVQGRNMLGVAVSQGQVMKSMYSSLMATDGKKEKFNVQLWNSSKKKYEWITVERTPKESEVDRIRQRDMTRAQIAFASDPLDEAGLKGVDVFFQKLHDSYFNVKFFSKKKEIKRPKNLTNTQLKEGLYGVYKDMNDAYFSKNYRQNRRYTADEVQERAGRIKELDINQMNTILPKMVNTLRGTDWSDNLYHRIAGKTSLDKSNNLEALYKKVSKMAKEELDWMRKLMGRESFRVPYNRHVETVINNQLYNRHIRQQLAQGDVFKFLEVVKGTTFGNQLRAEFKREENLYDVKKKRAALDEIARTGEDYLSNDLADMATLLNLQRIKKAGFIPHDKVIEISKEVEQLKRQSYLNVKERKALDFSAFVGSEAQRINKELIDVLDMHLGKKVKSDLAGDKRSATWDQAQIDKKIAEYKSKLNEHEKELFDHLMIGTYRRGDHVKLQEILDQVPNNKANLISRDVIKHAIDEASDTRLSRLGYNSEEVSDKAVRDHFRAMNEAFGETWKEPSKKETEAEVKLMEESIKENSVGEKYEVDDLVEGGLTNEGYAGISKSELTKADKDLIVRLATNLKKHNNKIGNQLNEVLAGILDKITGKPKDLNAMNKRDFEIVNNYLEEVESGTVFQKIWRKKNPEIERRYYAMFPESINRELMSYDIKWLKKEGYYVTKDGGARKGTFRKPTYFLEIMQNWIHKANDMGTGKATELATETEAKFLNLRELKDGNFLFQVSVAQRELGMRDIIKGSEEPESFKRSQQLNYETALQEVEKEFGLKWKEIENKSYTLTNDAGKRVTVTGRDIVSGNASKELTGIKDKQKQLFKQWHKVIAGDKAVFDEYKGEGYFPGSTGLHPQPIMNWRKFVTDMGEALEQGNDIPMNIGIDGMRHIARSMMADLAGPHSKPFEDMKIFKTGDLSEVYWPHMFFNRKTTEKSMKEAIKRINEDPTLTVEEKANARKSVLLRHKTLSGDWEFQDIQDWDKFDQLEYKKDLLGIAKAKKGREEKIKWTDSDVKFGSMQSRQGHIGGWARDMSVMNAYTRNLSNTYYRQISQIMSRNVLNDAYHRMRDKFGPELAGRWQKFFKLYAQGAMGNPDVIPEAMYNDPLMKLKGTPYAWWADNRVLKRMNAIREKLGIREKDLPTELKDFTFQDIKNWSNMEAKFELMSLLAHPKSSITNIFGGSVHTIQSAGIPALKKARDIKYLQRINPEWRSIEDVQNWVIKKGVVPEFLVHELGLGQGVTEANVKKFVGEFSSKLNSNDPIERKDVFSLGKKYGIGEAIVKKAALFMSVPERMLRRDAFMAHYIRAWESFGGAIKDPNHPFLIEKGKKGVKATQFLYEAPFRPMFARTALGKVMSRFQLFAWNSARFRNDIIRQAKRYGFKPGSEAFERYRRTMTADLFVVALANMFAFSLFDNSLPSPWNWFQDTSEWLFGDEKERDKAFFGMYPGKLAPLQIVTPPIARFPVSSLRQWIDDDYSKFSDYYIWTMFPFGRLGRDVFQPEQGLIDNPMRFMEKFTGMPVMDLARQKAKKEKAIEKGERYKQPKVGF